MRIGMIGLGAMGGAVMSHLLRHGHTVTVYARRAEVLQPFIEQGATAAASPREVAALSDVVFTMVTATADVDQVLFGPGGVAEAARPGLLVVDMSTIAPTAARDFATRLATLGTDMVDAPVSGGPDGARQGTLTIMAGGTPDAFERARPLFECFGGTILHVGPSGSGQVTKACHQLLLLITAEGVAEALTLAQRSGVDPALAHRVMMNGVASSKVLDRFGTKMVTRSFDAGIAARLYRKDLRIVLEHARTQRSPLPAGELVMTHIERMIEDGRADQDLSALITVLEEGGA